MKKILIITPIYIILISIFGLGLFHITQSWYTKLVCPVCVSLLTSIWLSLSMIEYEDYKELKRERR
tara:strand:- start:1192 stop:1389 length:198 start_codon:yes stop_codon:yes gene_type:complete